MLLHISNPKGGGWIQTLMETPTTVEGFTRPLTYPEAILYILRTGATDETLGAAVREYHETRT